MTKQRLFFGSGATSSHGWVIAVAFLLAGCGAAQSTGAGGGTTQAATTTTATAADQTVSTTAGATPAATATATPAAQAAIVISSPARGATVHSPFHVSGTADTFEAVFRLQLRDQSGKVLLDEQVQATSGTGTRGSFDAVVSTMARGSLTLVAFERSPKDGSPVNTVTVPITID